MPFTFQTDSAESATKQMKSKYVFIFYILSNELSILGMALEALEVQLTVEQHGFELCGFTYLWIIFKGNTTATRFRVGRILTRGATLTKEMPKLHIICGILTVQRVDILTAM